MATLRRWTRADWNEEGDEMAWCCTEEPEPYVGDRPVVESLGEELEAIVGTPVYVELRRRLDGDRLTALGPWPGATGRRPPYRRRGHRPRRPR